MEPLETLRTNRYWMAKRALLDIPIVDGALSPETFTQVVLYTDAQATIAALQARVQELEQWVQDQSTANLETMRHTDEMQSRALEAEQQLTQRTAELEAAKRERDEWIVKWDEHDHYPKGYVTAQIQLRERVQAELERARGLILALPKVEGEIAVNGRTIDEQYPTLSWQIASTGMDEFTDAIAALLKHRQGME